MAWALAAAKEIYIKAKKTPEMGPEMAKETYSLLIRLYCFALGWPGLLLLQKRSTLRQKRPKIGEEETHCWHTSWLTERERVRREREGGRESPEMGPEMAKETYSLGGVCLPLG